MVDRSIDRPANPVPAAKPAKKPWGWRKEPARHALASKGIKTSRVAEAHLERIEHKKAIRGTWGRVSSYHSRVYSVEKKYLGKDAKAEISDKDYERVVQPIFDTLADADELASRGEIRKSVPYIKAAKLQYDFLRKRFDVIDEADIRQFESEIRAVENKEISSSRQGAE